MTRASERRPPLTYAGAGCRHRRPGPGPGRDQAPRQGHLHAGRALGDRRLRRPLRPRARQPLGDRAGGLGGRRGNQAQGRPDGRSARHGRGRTWSTTASTTSWCRARGRCSSSTTWPPAGWSPGWPLRSWGACARLPGERVRAARRRDRGDAGVLSPGRVRPRRLHRRGLPARPAAAPRGRAGRRCARGAALHRPAHQRLLAGAQGDLRGRSGCAWTASCPGSA